MNQQNLMSLIQGLLKRMGVVESHEHDADYAPIVHDHDADYAQLATLNTFTGANNFNGLTTFSDHVAIDNLSDFSVDGVSDFWGNVFINSPATLTVESDMVAGNNLNVEGALHVEAPYVASYTTATAGAYPASLATIVDFPSALYDLHSSVTTGAAWKYTAPVTGYYRVSAQVVWDQGQAWVAGERSDLRVYKNGTFYRIIDFQEEDVAHSNYVRMGGSLTLQLNANDYIDIRVVHTRAAGNTTLIASASYNYVCVDIVS